MNNKNDLNTIVSIIALTAIVLAVFFVIREALEKQEIAECFQWQSQAEQYPNWYATDWQREQCSHYQILIK